MELELIGAAQTVTGSKHLVRTSAARVLLDCGLFQGRRQESFERNRQPIPHAAELDAVVLSHAHIDHSGALPLLVRAGFRGPIYTTRATRDLCEPMLLDAALIQEADAQHIAHLIQRGARDVQPVQPLYTTEDVAAVVRQMVTVPYHRPQPVARGVTVSFLDAGHVLGSAISVLDLDDGQGTRRRLAFTGDLGRRHLPILRDPEVPDGVQCLITESTYGDRLHDPVEQMGAALGEVIRRTAARGGKVIIPSFALERAQEIIYELKLLRRAGQIPALPVYVDSPLTVKLTDVFLRHPDCYDEAAHELLAGRDSPFDFEGLRYVSSVEDSKAIDVEGQPSVIISASGMCEAGRVLHHLRAVIGDEKSTVVIVGFQAPYTLGRRLVEGRRQVRIFGLEHTRRAEVVVLNGFSAHADQRDLVQFAEGVRAAGPLEQVILVHGEPPAQKALTSLLQARGIAKVSAPAPGARLPL